MDGEMDGAASQGEEWQGQQGDQAASGQQPQGELQQQAAQQVEGADVGGGADLNFWFGNQGGVYL